MKRGSTPSRCPTSKMILSNFASPEVGMSAGIPLTAGLAFATGANTRLKRMPVMLEKRKKERRTIGANLNERKWGALRGNFINKILQGYGLAKGLLSVGRT